MFKKVKESPLNYWEESSYLLAIPKNEEEDLLKNSLEKIVSIPGVEIKEKQLHAEKRLVSLRLVYEEEEYEVGFYPGGVSVPDYYLNKNFYFTNEERKKLLNAHTSLTIYMKFHEDSKKSFHLQLKLAVALVPDLIGLLDESAEKMLPAKWVVMTAESNVSPNPKSLFTVQAVADKNNKVWLHTHGLCRCGIPELEILESDQENYQNHYNLICAYAMYLLDKKGNFDQFEKGVYIGHLINDNPVVVTSRSWTEGLKQYKRLGLGNLKDRQDGHNTKTNIVFLYKSAEDEKKGILSKVSIYDELWGENPLFFFSDEETERMKKLAYERFDCIKKAKENKENNVLLKIGLPLEEEGKFEHIWFELLEIKKDKLKAKLTQEPYDVLNMHTGDIAWYTKEDVTDWLIYTKDFMISPDNAYLLENNDNE